MSDLARHTRTAFTTGTGQGHLAHEAGLEQKADAYFLSLPHGISATYAARLRASHPSAVVIDLSGDLRLPTAASYREWYGHDHPAPALLGQAPYGLTELDVHDVLNAFQCTGLNRADKYFMRASPAKPRSGIGGRLGSSARRRSARHSSPGPHETIGVTPLF